MDFMVRLKKLLPLEFECGKSTHVGDGEVGISVDFDRVPPDQENGDHVGCLVTVFDGIPAPSHVAKLNLVIRNPEGCVLATLTTSEHGQAWFTPTVPDKTNLRLELT